MGREGNKEPTPGAGHALEGPMKLFVRGFLAVAAAMSSVVAIAQNSEPEALRWSLEEFQSTCIPLWPDELTEGGGDCTVAEFGEIGEFDGVRYYYARYHDDSRYRPEDVLVFAIEFNALVLLRADSADDRMASVFHVRQQWENDWHQIYRKPEIIQTDHGSILYSQGLGAGWSGQQFSHDRYWLWRSGDWVEIDVHGWLPTMREQVPDGFQLGGIYELAQALPTMTYEISARRDGDATCCPSGGTIRIQFEWDDLTLRVASFEHEPDAEPRN